MYLAANECWNLRRGDIKFERLESFGQYMAIEHIYTSGPLRLVGQDPARQ